MSCYSQFLVGMLLSICLFSACEPSKTVRRGIAKIHIEAESDNSIQIIDGQANLQDNAGPRFKVPSIATDLIKSNIVITDTIAGRDIVITDTIAFQNYYPDGLDIGGRGYTPEVYHDLRLGGNGFYCQEYNSGRTATDRGEVGTHATFNEANAIQSFPQADYYVFAPTEQAICFLPKTSNNTDDRTCFSTTNKQICVFVKNGTYYVIEQ